MNTLLRLLIILSSLSGLVAFAADSPSQRLSLDAVMTKSEQEDTGVSKLSAKEKAALEQWLTGFATKVVTASATIPKAAAYAAAGQKHWVSSKADGGAFIQLEDGSFWQISSLDKIKTMLWLPTENIVVVESSNPQYPYKLVGERDTAEAKLITGARGTSQAGARDGDIDLYDSTGNAVEAPAFYHFVDLFELQQYIAFSKDAVELNLHLKRHFEVMSCSCNAAIRMRFLRQSVKPVSSVEIANNADSYVFAFRMLPHSQHQGDQLIKALFQALREHDFFGRLELYDRIFKRGNDVYYDLGVGLACSTPGYPQVPDGAWWRAFQARFARLVDSTWGFRLSDYCGATLMSDTRRDFDGLAVMDMEHGVAVSRD